MTASQAAIGYDTTFAIEDAPGSGVFVALAEVFEVTTTEVSVDQVDVTHFKSPGRAKEYIPQLKDNGSASASMNYVPDSATDQRIRTLLNSGAVVAMRITFPNDVQANFSASVESYSQTVPVEDRMTATVSFKVTGAVAIVDPST